MTLLVLFLPVVYRACGPSLVSRKRRAATPVPCSHIPYIPLCRARRLHRFMVYCFAFTLPAKTPVARAAGTAGYLPPALRLAGAALLLLLDLLAFAVCLERGVFLAVCLHCTINSAAAPRISSKQPPAFPSATTFRHCLKRSASLPCSLPSARLACLQCVLKMYAGGLFTRTPFGQHRCHKQPLLSSLATGFQVRLQPWADGMPAAAVLCCPGYPTYLQTYLLLFLPTFGLTPLPRTADLAPAERRDLATVPSG